MTGNIVNTATVTSDTPDPNPGNNTSTVVVGLLTPRCQAFVGLEEVTPEQLLELNENAEMIFGVSGDIILEEVRKFIKMESLLYDADCT